MLPFVNINRRIHPVPPCNIDEQDLREGLQILDAALGAVDRRCADGAS